MSLSDYVLCELRRVAERSPMAEVFARSAALRIPLSMDEVVEDIRADRSGATTGCPGHRACGVRCR